MKVGSHDTSSTGIATNLSCRTDLSIAGLTSLSYFTLVLSDVAQGDVDEGFDEEFEDKDINDINDTDPEPNNFELSDLDPKELQQLLNDPQFDLGVDVLEQPHQILSPINSTSYNFSPSPCSPYQAMVTSSPCETTTTTPTEMSRSLYYNDYNLGGVENPPSVQSNHSASTSASYASTSASYASRVDDLSLPMLHSDHDAFPDSTSEVLSLLSEGEGPVVDPTTPEHSPPQYQTSPVLTTAASGGLDLADTGTLLDNLIELSTSLSAEASVDTHSMYMFGNGSGQLNLSPSASSTTAGVTTNVITLMHSNMLSQPSAADRPSIPLTPRRPTPTSLVSYQQPSRHSTSRSPAPSPSPKSPGEQELSDEDRKLVDMPYYQFRKMLDDPSIPERRKEEVKSVRRKGRNKIAAKVCRHKKLHMIMGLEQEVEQLRKAKSNIALKTKTLEKEIAELKKRCHTR